MEKEEHQKVVLMEEKLVVIATIRLSTISKIII